jgi:pimeloyl-ACP methyl ester carboxylesterase
MDDCTERWSRLGFTTRLATVNGVSLHLAEGGHGDPVVLLHGYPQSGEEWRLVAPRLAKSHRVIVPDLRGMGLSDAAPEGYDLGSLADDLHHLVESAGLPRVKIVGHDWGGAVGAMYALLHREKVTHLAFLESALAGAGFEALWDFSKPNAPLTFIPFLLMGGSDTEGDTTAALLAGRESVFLHHLWATFTGDKRAAPFDGWAPYVEAMTRPGIVRSSASLYRQAYKSADQVRGLLANRLDIPILAIAGELGIGANHEALVRGFANNITASVVLQGAGHFLPEERPNEVFSALEAFLGAKS